MNQLTTLDVAELPALKDLDCSQNQLTALNVSRNQLTILRINRLPALEYLIDSDLNVSSIVA